MYQPRFDAFISYRHTEPDKTIAEKLHKMLETYRVPGPVVKKIGKKKIGRVFRDREELPTSSNLAENIEQALQNSQYLIVICSPRTPHSQWVHKEIETFSVLHGHDRILALLIEGEPQESFPQPLRYVRKRIMDDDGQEKEVVLEVEPLAADIRAQNLGGMKKKLKTEILRLLAPILGCGFDDLRQRHRERMIKRIVTVSLSLALFFLAFGSFSTYQAIIIRQKSDEVARQSEIIKQKSEEVELKNEMLEEQVDKTLRGQSLFLANKSLEILDSGDRMYALLVAREALPKNMDEPERPYVEEAEYALSEALYAYRASGETLGSDIVLNHNLSVQTMAISPDEKTCVTITNNGSIFVWNLENGQMLNQYRDLNNKPKSYADVLYVDNTSIIIATDTGLLCLEVPSLSEKWKCRGNFTGYAVSEDRSKVVAVDDTFYVLNPATGELIDEYSIEGIEDPLFLLFTMALSPNGQYACARSRDEIFAVDLVSKQYIGSFKARYDDINELAVSNDGVLGIISYDEDKKYAIELMDLTHGKRIFLQEEMNYTHDLNINPYHQENFYYISGRTVYTMSAVNGEVNTAVKHDNLINDYAFTPKYLISVDDSGKFLMTLINRSSDLSLMLSFPRSLKQVVWCNDQIAVAENSKVYIVRRNRDDNEKADYLKGHAEYIERAATSTDGKRLVSCTYDHIRNQGELIIWDLENLKLLASTSVEDQIIQMTFIENANKVFTVSRQGHLSVYDASDLSLLHQTSTNILSPTIFMSPDRSLCLVAGSWRDNRIYRTSDLTRLDMGEILDATSVTAVFSQDNRWLFFADYLGLMMIDLEAKSVVREISYTISDLKLSYNGNYLACLCTDNTVRLMNAQTLEEIRNFSLTDMTIKSVIFDSQDQTLFFISDDYLIRRYRLDNGEFISEEDTKEIEVEEILFSPDNKYYITIGRYESLLWSNEANKPLSRIMSLLAVSPDFDKVMIRKSNDVCIMPFYNTKMLIEEAERKLKGRTLTEQEKKQLFIVD